MREGEGSSSADREDKFKVLDRLRRYGVLED
jgi:hypothetical protein